MSKAVAKVEEAALPMEFMDEIALDSGAGTSNITLDDVAIPFLRIAQKMSPVCSKRDAAYIEGCEEGHIYNTVTQRLYDGEEGVVIIPCEFDFKHLEWAPRESGGGIKGRYGREDYLPETTKNDRGQDITADGNILSPTAEHYVMVCNSDGTYDQVLLSMSSTQLKVSKRLCALMKQQTIQTPNGTIPAPSYSRMYKLTTVMESNDQGEWMNYKVEMVGPVADINVYRAARAFNQSVNAGKVNVRHVDEDIPM